ncbi:hypothetical protein GV794_05735 [Nocardia cyriacigeorgica]|uniref:Uncharacterized protein n=1 Tax=Nocardia cyriacigeorgica TaxID=135487 RepID=A0ABX0CLF1_9NOCA|nr:hypothetical protein [Nocardia cyriacigeorgica]NEW41107.1 hypothetical protein [Nocardia cyriacigeorgica]NEW52992.1 hypothetical protein [Nocardia cyriacigeorgica]NEW55161.1 hypothetical protein [Nocardia cyriacigeorgica]
MAIAPAHAETGLQLTESPSAVTERIDGGGTAVNGVVDFLTSGSAQALNRMWCGTLWAPTC